MVVPAPRLPELDTISRPAISPCNASSALVKAIPSTLLISKVCWATDTSLLGMNRPPDPIRVPFTTTSCMVWLSDSRTMSNTSWSPTVMVFVLSPTNDIRNLFLGLFTSMEKLPLKSVCAAETIRLLASISVIFAIITGPMASLTVPDIRLLCAIIVREAAHRQAVSNNFLLDIIISL